MLNANFKDTDSSDINCASRKFTVIITTGYIRSEKRNRFQNERGLGNTRLYQIEK